MGDNKANITKAILELEEMYLGIPDESVNLTFKDFAEVRQISNNTKPESISQVNIKKKEGSSSLKKIPSIDFNRALQASSPYYNNHHHNRLEHINEEVVNHHHQTYSSPNNYNHHLGHHAHLTMGHDHQSHRHNHHQVSPRCHVGIRHGVDSNMDYRHNDHVSGTSLASMYQDERVGKRRPGIPHSKICTVCSTHTYIFRHRCLVCGRAYCKNCVNIGMGDMKEGRKCTECLGRRFSQRYIQRAGEVGCCFTSYPSAVRKVELKWAEMGPRRSGEGAYKRSEMMSTSRSPISPRSPTVAHSSSNPNSFVMSSSFSPYSPTHLHLPF